MTSAADNATLDPALAAGLAALQAADAAPTARTDFWRCADPPFGCGELKPASEFSFEARKTTPTGGGRDLCHDCKRTAPKRHRQRTTRQEIATILEQMGRAKETEIPVTLAKMASAGARAFDGIDELFAGIAFNVEALENNGKFTSAGNMRLGVAKIIGKAAERIEAMKPVEQMDDSELLKQRQQLNQVIVNNVHNYYIQQADVADAPGVTLEEPAIEHAPASTDG